MRRPALALLLVAALGITLAAVGCGEKKNVLAPNLAPETSVYVQGPVDPVSHRVHLYWFGSDPDGDVVGYQMRFVPSFGGAADPKWDTVYCALPGRCTDSVFTLMTGDSALIHRQFEIRAMDNQGLVDATPAILPLQLTNRAPLTHILNPYKLSDSTFASATIRWEVNDPDGGGPGLRYRIWLDGHQAEYDSTTANEITVASSKFLQGGTYLSGYRTLYVQAIDDGGRTGPPDSTTWFVRAPGTVLDAVTKRARLLVVDDLRSTNGNNFGADTLYANVLARAASSNPYNEVGRSYIVLPPGSYSILKPEFSNPFRSARDLMQTFRQFDAVVWYRAYELNVSTTLQTYQDSVRQFVRDGGKLYLEGLYMIEGHNSFGTFREDFVQEFLNCRRLHQTYETSALDSTVGIGVNSTANLRSSAFADAPIRLARPPALSTASPGIRGFVENDSSQVAIWAVPGALTSPTNTEDMPFAMSVSRPPGRLMLISFPVRALVSPPPTQPRSLFPSFRVLSRLLFEPQRGLLAP